MSLSSADVCPKCGTDPTEVDCYREALLRRAKSMYAPGPHTGDMAKGYHIAAMQIWRLLEEVDPSLLIDEARQEVEGRAT